MAYDLVIRGGSVVLAGEAPQPIDIAIADGRIAALLAPGIPCDAPGFPAHGLTILPGALDVHLHLGHGRDISRPRTPADAAQETAAAALGGIAAFIPYLLATEPYDTVFDDVRAITEAGARIDFGYHFCISTEAQLAALPAYVRNYGVSSFKMFMNNRGGEGARLGLPDIDDGFLLRLCELAAATGAMVCPHPESIEMSWVLRDRLRAADPEGQGGLALWNATRPSFVEADAVQRAACAAEHAGARLYIVHTTSAAALDAALHYRRRGARIAIETCPHYLTHDTSWPGGDIGKINPPLREPADREALWAAVLSGAIDTIATDHVHRDATSKQGGIWAASPGCPGLETMLPVLLTEGHYKRGLSLARIAALTAENPARLMGLAHRKGRIAPGLDADLTFLDLDAAWTLGSEHIASSAAYSIYENWQFRGRVTHLAVRGQFVLRDGALDDRAVGTGRYLRRTSSG